jgi:hypothetical protein
MFWTMGPQQCGKAAQAGWRELARPVALDPEAGLWPFEGCLAGLLTTRRFVLAETYPAECYGQVLSIRGRFSKQRRDDRLALAPQMVARAADLGLDLGPLAGAIGRGFYDVDGADNGFDATVGLLAMLAVVRGRREDGAPDTTAIRHVEGWMLGLSTTPPRGGSASTATAR